MNNFAFLSLTTIIAFDILNCLCCPLIDNTIRPANFLTQSQCKNQNAKEATNFYLPILFDTLIIGGLVVDTELRTVAQADIGIVDGKVLAISLEGINPAQALKVINATGYYVTPGLVDLHTHVFAGATYWGIDPDAVAATTGVTTWVDAGSAGAYNFPALKKNVIEKSSVRIFAFLHISGIGLTGRTFESSVEANLDYEMTNITIQENRSIIKGIKVRMDKDATNGTGTLALELARVVADFTGVPLMIHIGIAPPELTEIFELLRPNDILTHAFTGHTNRLVDEEGNPLPIVEQLLDNQIILDLGHGSGSFSYHSAEGLINAGIFPDVISSDMHQISRLGPMFDLPTTISKLINLGLPLADAIAKATIVPAQIIQENEIGVIKIGYPADIAIFNLEDDEFIFQDSAGEERQGRYKLTNTLTMVNGIVLERKKESGPSAWVLRDLDLISGNDTLLLVSHKEP